MRVVEKTCGKLFRVNKKRTHKGDDLIVKVYRLKAFIKNRGGRDPRHIIQ